MIKKRIDALFQKSYFTSIVSDNKTNGASSL